MPLEQQCMNAWNRPLSQTCPPNPNDHSLIAISPCVCVCVCLRLSIASVCECVCVFVRKGKNPHAKHWLFKAQNKEPPNRDVAAPAMWHFDTSSPWRPPGSSRKSGKQVWALLSLSADITEEGWVVRSGGLSLITLPRTRERTCMEFCTTMAVHTQEYGDGEGGGGGRGENKRGLSPCHSLHEQPQLAECEVFLSRTRPANSNTWPAATLLSITNTGPIYPSVPPRPPSHTANPGGTPHNGSVATVTDISMPLMFCVVFFFFYSPQFVDIQQGGKKTEALCARNTKTGR